MLRKAHKSKLLSAAMVGAGLVTVSAASAAEHLTMEEIVVTDSAITDPTGTVVGSKTLEKGKNLNVADAIRNEPDITTRRRSAVGDTADSVAIRGLSGNRIMLNIDGRTVNGAGVVGGHYIDWGTLPLDNIEKIEIIRGGSSVLYGGNALGGVINVITKKPGDEPEGAFFSSISAGEDGYLVQNYRLSHAAKVGIFGYSLAGSWQDSDAYLWNNDFTGSNLNLATYFDMPLDGQLFLGVQYARAERGFIINNRSADNPDSPLFNTPLNSEYPAAFGENFSPYSGSAFQPGPGANWDKTKYYLNLGYSQPIEDGLIELKLYKNYEDRAEKNYSQAGVVAGQGEGELVLDRDVESDRSYGGRLNCTKAFGEHEVLAGVDHQVLTFGDTTINYVDMNYNSVNWYGPPPTSYAASSEGDAWGFYLQDSWQLHDNLLLSGGLRYDRYENTSINGSTSPELEDKALTPKLTVTWSLSGADTLTASVYQAMRIPGLPETYWWAAGATGGNPVLKPEKNNAAELVYEHELAKAGRVRLAAYYYDIQDYIMSRFNPNWRGVYNIDSAHFYGASVDARWQLTPWLTARASLAYQKSSKEGDSFDTAGLSDEIDYLPEWKGCLGADVKLPAQMVLAADLRYVGESQTIYSYSSGWPAQNVSQLETIDAYAVVDLDLKIPIWSNSELSLYADNLLDTGYEERFGYPMPGVLVGAALKVTF